MNVAVEGVLNAELAEQDTVVVGSALIALGKLVARAEAVWAHDQLAGSALNIHPTCVKDHIDVPRVFTACTSTHMLPPRWLLIKLNNLVCKKSTESWY